VHPLSAVRSTLVAAGAKSLRALGVYDRYLAALPETKRAALTMAVAGSWIPLDSMMVHYAACDALGLSDEQVVEIGRGVGSTIRDVSTAILKSLASGAGATPWTLFDAYGRIWSRVFLGGDASYVRHGPKDAVLLVRAFPIARFAYLRGTFCGVHERLFGIFCSKIYTQIVRTSLTEQGFDLRLSWV
jgi:hypothetical protein